MQRMQNQEVRASSGGGTVSANDAVIQGTKKLDQMGGLRRAHWAIVLGSFLATLGFTVLAVHSVEQRNADRFDRAAEQVIDQLVERLERNAELLRATAGFARNAGALDDATWQAFIERLDLANQYPVLNGLAVVQRVSRDAVEDFVAQRRALHPGFDLRPEHDQDHLLPIVQAAPARLAETVLGYDLAFESERRRAMDEAVRTDSVLMTGAVAPTRAGAPGVVMFAPFRSNTAIGESSAQTPEGLGAVVTSMLFERLMSGTLDPQRRLVRLRIADSGSTLLDENAELTDPERDAEPLFEQRRTLSVFGREWHLDIRTTIGFRTDAKLATPWLVLLVGLAIDLLLLTTVCLHLRGEARLLAAARKLRQERQALARSNELLDAFGGIVSHDLKSPLLGIRLMVGEIEAELDERGSRWEVATRSHLSAIVQRIDRAETLIDGVMAYSGLGGQDECLEHVDVASMVRQIGDSLGLTDRSLIVDGQLPQMLTSAVRLRQVLENLIGNAVKYHPVPVSCTVRIGAKQHGDYWRFRVADDGCGIDPGVVDRIFEPFVTAHGTARVDSSGIGLATVSKHVAQVGGTIEVERFSAQGTTFAFTWPQRMPGPDGVDSSLVDGDEKVSMPKAA